LLIAFPREGKDSPALPFGDLGYDVGGHPEAVKPQRFSVARDPK
jgi:hypothetical protein